MASRVIRWVRDNKTTSMKLELINGTFPAHEVAQLLTKMIQVKIDFHQQKINTSDHEEDIKQREMKIKFLQNQLAGIQQELRNGHPVSVSGQVLLEYGG